MNGRPHGGTPVDAESSRAGCCTHGSASTGRRRCQSRDPGRAAEGNVEPDMGHDVSSDQCFLSPLVGLCGRGQFETMPRFTKCLASTMRVPRFRPGGRERSNRCHRTPEPMPTPTAGRGQGEHDDQGLPQVASLRGGGEENEDKPGTAPKDADQSSQKQAALPLQDGADNQAWQSRSGRQRPPSAPFPPVRGRGPSRVPCLG